MTFLDAVYARAAQRVLKAAPGMARAPSWARAEARHERWNMPALDEAAAQADLYTKLAWIQIAVGAVAETVATTALKVYTAKTGDEPEAIPSHPFEMLLRQPNPLMSRMEFLIATVAWRKVTGNCYWWLNRAGEGDAPLELWIIPAHQIQPVPDGNSFLKGYVYTPSMGVTIPLEPWEVVHFKTWNPQSMYLGLSPLQALRYDTYGDLAAQEYNANFYAKDNAKSAGILAFSDFIEDGRWNRLQEDWKEQSGGTKNKRALMLRGAGAGGVQWITTQMSRQDMQYLEQRAFTKEEIFALFAPGLASVLAINATEANSTAGKDTFSTMAIYPQTVAIGEKATQCILPAYGDDLIAEFDDVRRVDTIIELQTQEEYSKTHTVDEIRAKYYQDKEIGDARGALLPAEIGKGLTDARAPEDKPAPQIMAPPTPADPDAAITAAGKAIDRRRWRDKATKAILRGSSASVPFDPEYLTDDEAMPIRAALKAAHSADDVWRALGEG